MNHARASDSGRSSRDRIARLLGRGRLHSGQVERDRPRPAAEDSGDPVWSSQGDPGQLELTEGLQGEFLARQQNFPGDSLHGAWRLDEVSDLDPRAFGLLCEDRDLGHLDPHRAVYLDTETTGLSGGAGTYVYMVGLGWFENGRFRVWQGFLGGPEQEPALLAESARRIASADAVVSFFGKSFDRHRLEDKMNIHGVPSPFLQRPHLDLYHPMRRVNGGQFENNRLQTLEVELLGLVRERDLPGSLAPAAWFDYLAGREHQLEGVFHHNLLDVLSLVTLTAHLGHTLAERRPSGEVLKGCSARRAWAVGRALWRAGQRVESIEWMGRAISRFDQVGDGTREQYWLYADCLRRVGRQEAALSALAELAEGGPDAASVLACEALAKMHEHGLGNLVEAARWVRRAVELLDALESAGVTPRAVPTTESLSKRLERVQRKAR